MIKQLLRVRTALRRVDETLTLGSMGTGARREDLRSFFERASRDRQAVADALAIIQQFNARGRMTWFWPTIGAALVTKHHWLVIACDGCDTITEMDLTMKRRDPDAPIRVALSDVRCPRCNGGSKPRITALAKLPSS